jgi:hypothetical protein
LNLKEVKSSSVTSLFKVQYSLLHWWRQLIHQIQ